MILSVPVALRTGHPDAEIVALTAVDPGRFATIDTPDTSATVGSELRKSAPDAETELPEPSRATNVTVADSLGFNVSRDRLRSRVAMHVFAGGDGAGGNGAVAPSPFPQTANNVPDAVTTKIRRKRRGNEIAKAGS